MPPSGTLDKRSVILYWMLGAGTLGRPRGMVWGGRREEGSGWGTHVYLWRIHFNIWQNQYNIVKFKNKIKLKKKVWSIFQTFRLWKNHYKGFGVAGRTPSTASKKEAYFPKDLKQASGVLGLFSTTDTFLFLTKSPSQVLSRALAWELRATPHLPLGQRCKGTLMSHIRWWNSSGAHALSVHVEKDAAHQKGKALLIMNCNSWGMIKWTSHRELLS